VIDRKESLIVETKDDAKDSSYETAGLGAYYNSKPISLSYASIFDSLWKQTELYEKLSETDEQLKIHNKMQKEFLDIDYKTTLRYSYRKMLSNKEGWFT
jgi:hypothetical protein